MDISKLMEKYNLTGTREDFLAAMNEYQAARHRPTPSEEVLISQIAGDLVDLDQGVAGRKPCTNWRKKCGTRPDASPQ